MATPVCKAQTPCMSCQNLEAVRCGSCLSLSSAHCLLALLPQGEARYAFERALTAFLFCLYVVLLYLTSCLLEFVSFTLAGLPIAILPTCKPSLVPAQPQVEHPYEYQLYHVNWEIAESMDKAPRNLMASFFFFSPLPLRSRFPPPSRFPFHYCSILDREISWAACTRRISSQRYLSKSRVLVLVYSLSSTVTRRNRTRVPSQ
ncbi:hypothetical protein J3E68DRAFT_225422 [Trichoderma sp. SZMC 28012]